MKYMKDSGFCLKKKMTKFDLQYGVILLTRHMILFVNIQLKNGEVLNGNANRTFGLTIRKFGSNPISTFFLAKYVIPN